MKKILLMFIFTLTLVANENSTVQNPSIYASIGDKIYNNIPSIENLKTIDKYAAFKLKIDAYTNEVIKAKKLGFAVQSGEKSKQKLIYLDTLRKLEKENNYFYNSANKNFIFAIDTQDNQFYLDLVNSGIIDVDIYRYKILNYYNKHAKDIDSRGIIDELIKEEKAKKAKRRYVRKTKKQIQEEKIKRVREYDIYQQKLLEDKLSKELEEKKLQIRQEQQKELFKN